MKTCTDCRQSLEPSCFYAHPRTFDRLLPRCKECHKKKVTQNRNANLARYREKDRERSRHPDRIKALTASTKRWRQEDKRRMKCHNAVARAILNGRLVRKPCEQCGRSDSHAHHEDYDQPYVVKWLCPVCHSAEHKTK